MTERIETINLIRIKLGFPPLENSVTKEVMKMDIKDDKSLWEPMLLGGVGKVLLVEESYYDGIIERLEEVQNNLEVAISELGYALKTDKHEAYKDLYIKNAIQFLEEAKEKFTISN